MLCIGAGWLGLRLYQARREANAVEAIQAAGGQVIYDFQRGQSLSGPAGRRHFRPRELRRLLGEHFFDRVQAVVFDFQPIDDAAMRPWGNLAICESSGSFALASVAPG